MRATFLGVMLLVGMGDALSAQESKADPQYRKIVRTINTMRLTVDFRGASLEEALDYIRDAANINIVVHAAVAETLSEDEQTVTLKLRKLRLKSILKLMLEGKGLTAIYKEGVLLVLPKEKFKRKKITRMYDVADILFKITDFPGPKVELTAPSAAGTGLMGATFSLTGGDTKPGIDQDYLEELIQENTGGESWDGEGVSIRTLSNRWMFITQSARVHREIRRLLNLLRRHK